MRVLGLSAYPVEAAATRFRLAQFVGPLAAAGIELEVSPFLTGSQFATLYAPGSSGKKVFSLLPSVLKRAAQVREIGKYDLLFVQREAMFFGPALFEWLYRNVSRTPMVLDLDDATYVPYVSPSYGRLGSYLKFFGKTDKLIAASRAVTCGNRHIAEYAQSLGAKAVVVPTVVNTDEFKPAPKDNAIPVIGWVGTHSTFPFLEWLFPILEKLALKHRFVLKIVGAGRDNISLNGIEVLNLPWDLGREVKDFQSLDIGLYPLTLSDSANEQWLLGKSGFKAIQYMAVGVPFVMSPIGVAAELGEPGVTHFNASSEDDWYTHLDNLLSDSELQVRLGEAGRRYSLENFTVEKQADTLARTFREAISKD
jgi:glycosyltransferase involved in cell wall biosynthesis